MNYNNLTKQELLDLVMEQQTLKDAVEVKDKEIITLKDTIHQMKKEFEGAVKKEEIKKYTKEVEENAKKSAEIANQYIRAHRDLMKIFKANLDSAISHEELLSEKLK
jgi:hypothetical protein